MSEAEDAQAQQNVPLSAAAPVPEDWFDQLRREQQATRQRVEEIAAQSAHIAARVDFQTMYTAPPGADSKPFWYPDMKGFLAIAIVVIIGFLAVAFVFGTIPDNDKVMTLLTGMVGALLVIFKDVFQYTFGSSAGSSAKDAVIQQQAVTAAATEKKP